MVKGDDFSKRLFTHFMRPILDFLFGELQTFTFFDDFIVAPSTLDGPPYLCDQ